MNLIELINQLENLFSTYGYGIVFVSNFIEITPFGWAIPGGTILIVAGFFAYGDKVSLLNIIVAGWSGAWLTLILAYLIGHKSGYYLVKKFRQEKNAERGKRLLKSHGGPILITSMIANLTRFWTAFVAGAEKYDLPRFMLYSGIASLAWTSTMVTIGFLAGSERQQLESALGKLGIISWLLLFVAIFILYLSMKKEFRKEK